MCSLCSLCTQLFHSQFLIQLFYVQHIFACKVSKFNMVHVLFFSFSFTIHRAHKHTTGTADQEDTENSIKCKSIAFTCSFKNNRKPYSFFYCSLLNSNLFIFLQYFGFLFVLHAHLRIYTRIQHKFSIQNHYTYATESSTNCFTVFYTRWFSSYVRF